MVASNSLPSLSATVIGANSPLQGDLEYSAKQLFFEEMTGGKREITHGPHLLP